MPAAPPILEVCIASVEDAVIAQEGGADRLELNATLELGGLTPSLGLAVEVLAAVDLPVIVMLRPRPGDFCYSTADLRVLFHDAERLLNVGAAGIACGALRPDGALNLDCWHQLVRMAGGRQVVFHRAFDELADPEAALLHLIDAGTTRIMSSGGSTTALAGTTHVARYQTLAAGRLQLLPAGGIDAGNVREIQRRTGCREIHGSFSESIPSSRPYNADIGQRRRTSLLAVKAVRRELDHPSSDE